MQSIQQRLFYGWVIVAAATIIIATGMGLMDALGVFMEPLETTFGWSRGQIGRASLVCWLVSGLSSFLFGALSDRIGTRVVVLIGGLVFGVGMLVLSHMQTLWHLYLAYGVFVGGGTGALMVPLTATTTRWFTQRRALAVAITNCSAALGSMLVAPLTRYLVERFDWQTAFGLYALLAWLIILPLAWLIRNRPEEMGLQPLGHRPAAVPYAPSIPDHANRTLREILAQPPFWIIAVVNFLCCAAHSGPLFHTVSAAIDAGMGKLAAATVFAVISLSSIPARLATGLLADRYGTKTVLVTWLFLQALAVLLYLVPQGFGSYAAVGVYFGIAYGGVMPLYAVATREFFGERAMGASYGVIVLFTRVGMGLGPWLGGWAFDRTGAYTFMYLLSVLFASAGAILALWLRPPVPPRPAVLRPPSVASA